MARKRKPTRFDELQVEAADRGFLVRRHSPGDGRTRYKFFEKAYVRRKYGAKGMQRQTYFGPASSACTVIGLKNAYHYLHTGECKQR